MVISRVALLPTNAPALRRRTGNQKVGYMRLVAFDLDDTLAPSKSPLSPKMAEVLERLLERIEVAVISGGRFEQFDSQLISNLGSGCDLRKLHLLPTCGTRYYRYNGEWELIYAFDLSEDARDKAVASIEDNAKRLGLWEGRTWGPRIEDRGSQITFSALGQNAPIAEKRAWDPTGEKKAKLAAALAPILSELEVRSGGSTSVDITLKGVDKAYGMNKLIEHTGIPKEEMVFVGDRLDEGGNDYPVISTGIKCVSVTGPEDTCRWIDRFITTCDAAPTC